MVTHFIVGIVKSRPTQRAADKWDSARFLSLFLASSFIRLPSQVLSRPLAANADRWLAKSKNIQRLVLKIMRTRFVTTILLALIISACSSATQAPLPTETLQPTVEPTSTKLPATFTSTPEPENTSTPEINSNTETAISDWEGLPIMPEAKDGEPAGLGYLYSVKVTVEEAEKFYMEQMELDGWTLSDRQTSETSLFGGPSTILDFQRDSEAVNIMLIFSTNNNHTMVLLSVKP
jgi:hypothetical protein